MFGKSKKKETLSRRERAAMKKAERRREQQRQAELAKDRREKQREMKRRKAEEKRQREKEISVQKSIPYLEMAKDGICRVQEHVYSKTVRFYDINYQLAQQDDKNAIFENWCEFLNYFDSSIHFQLSFINHKTNMVQYERVIEIQPQNDNYDDVRM